MKNILSLVIALIFISAGGSKADAAFLRTTVSVAADVVRLGDLFGESGETSTFVVAKSPPPGERLVLSAGQLETLAERGGLKWTTDNRFLRSTVTRQARTIDTEEITAKVIAALRAEGLEESWRIALGRNDVTAQVALDEDQPVRVSNTRFSLHSKRFSTVLEVPRGADNAERKQITGNIFQVIKVPVPAHRMQRGDIIGDRDLDYISIPREKVGRTVLLDKSRIVGKEVRRLLTNGKPIRAGDIRPPVIVEKGTLVTIVLQTNRMRISARGKALQDGAAGETVRVLNTRSRQTVEGVVASHNRVVLTMGSAR
jgi:flagellar basal body P-ring formation protein FlgA